MSAQDSESEPRNIRKANESKRFDIKHGDAVFSTVKSDVEAAIDHARNEFPDEDADNFEAVECPECGSEGRSQYSFTRDNWSCKECGNSWDGETL